MKTLKMISVFLIMLVLSCTNNKPAFEIENKLLPPHNGEIRIIGVNCFIPLVEQLAAEYKKNHPLTNFDIRTAETNDAISYVFSENADLVLISDDFTEKLDTSVWMIPVARLSVVLIINRNNPYWLEIAENGIKKDDLEKIFTNKITSWGELFNHPDENKISVYLCGNQAGSTNVLSGFLWLENSEIKGIKAEGEMQLINVVAKDPLALGYCNFISTFNSATKEFIEKVSIVPLDVNQNGRLDLKENFYHNFSELQRAIWLGKYPCKLNRPLQFVVSEKPATKELVDFLMWVYTDGQKIIPEMGYKQLRSSEIKSCLAYLEN